MCDGVSAMNLVIAIIENYMGQIDGEFEGILEMIVLQLQFLETNKDNISYTKYKSMVL